VTAVGIFIAAMVARIGMYTTDQVMIQRFQTTRSIGEARKGFFITAVSDTVWIVALTVVGVALSAYFRHFPMPAEVQANPDQIFPYFLGQVFLPGMVGLVVAAILAASLSSIDSAVNSMTSVVMSGYLTAKFLWDPEYDENAADDAAVLTRVKQSRMSVDYAIMERARLQAAKQSPANARLLALASARFQPFFAVLGPSGLTLLSEGGALSEPEYRKGLAAALGLK
jgi:hypothetical protein